MHTVHICDMRLSQNGIPSKSSEDGIVFMVGKAVRRALRSPKQPDCICVTDSWRACSLPLRTPLRHEPWTQLPIIQSAARAADELHASVLNEINEYIIHANMCC